MILLLALLALLACSEKLADTGASEGPTLDGDADTDADADADADGAFDPWAALDPNHCEEAPGYEALAGATAYFIGEYTRGGGVVTGVETAAYYATSEWEAAGGADCVVVWNTNGTEGSPAGCSACAYAVTVDANLDTDATTCPSALWAGQESWGATYNITVADDGSATFAFDGVAEPFAAGASSATAFSFLTDPACEWF